MKKRILSILLCLVLVLSCCGCSSKNHNYPETNCRLLVLGEDITEGNYVRMQDCGVVELPVIAILKACNVKIKWDSKTYARFEINGNMFELDTKKLTLYTYDFDFNLFNFPLEGDSYPDGYVYTLKNLDGEVIADRYRLAYLFGCLGVACHVDEEKHIADIHYSRK